MSGTRFEPGVFLYKTYELDSKLQPLLRERALAMFNAAERSGWRKADRYRASLMSDPSLSTALAFERRDNVNTL